MLLRNADQEAKTEGPAKEVSVARAGLPVVEPWALGHLQHQQDGWDDEAWVGKESEDLAQEGREIIFNGLMEDVVHSVFPTGKKRGCVTVCSLAHLAHPTPTGLELLLAAILLEEPELGVCSGSSSKINRDLLKL